jgi:hypothetical protein
MTIRYPCPGTPAIADILQAVGAFVVYTVDTLLLNRKRNWSYRTVNLSDGCLDGSGIIQSRDGCQMFAPAVR